MKIRLGELRKLIRSVLSEAGGAPATKGRPMQNNPMAASMPDREQIGRISVKDAEDPDELTPHLREPVYDEDDCWGPVPPTSEKPHASPDIYANDFSVLPTSSVRR